jgi:aminomethyltransferase
MKHTPLIEQHRAHGGKLVDFAGWEMPIQYASVVDEYRHVREAAGLFDVSHMGRIRVAGERALGFLQYMTTNNVAAIPLLGSQYSMVCNPSGGIKDDIFVYHTKPNEYLVCVNASNRTKIVSWFEEHRESAGVSINDESDKMAQLALQGPASSLVLDNAGLTDVVYLKPRTALPVTIGSEHCLISRTGYTGEPGWELYIPSRLARNVWDDLLKAGHSADITPAGLGARDLLRLEMGYLLYGNDISEETTPVEANASWVIDFNKGDFMGRAALVDQQRRGLDKILIAFELLEKSVPRHGFPILDPASSQPIGEVTSGNFSPLLQKGIGLGYVPAAFVKPATDLSVDIRGKLVPAVTVKPPFYRKPRPAQPGPIQH